MASNKDLQKEHQIEQIEQKLQNLQNLQERQGDMDDVNSVGNRYISDDVSDIGDINEVDEENMSNDTSNKADEKETGVPGEIGKSSSFNLKSLATSVDEEVLKSSISFAHDFTEKEYASEILKLLLQIIDFSEVDESLLKKGGKVFGDLIDVEKLGEFEKKVSEKMTDRMIDLFSLFRTLFIYVNKFLFMLWDALKFIWRFRLVFILVLIVFLISKINYRNFVSQFRLPFLSSKKVSVEGDIYKDIHNVQKVDTVFPVANIANVPLGVKPVITSTNLYNDGNVLILEVYFRLPSQIYNIEAEFVDSAGRPVNTQIQQVVFTDDKKVVFAVPYNKTITSARIKLK